MDLRNRLGPLGPLGPLWRAGAELPSSKAFISSLASCAATGFSGLVQTPGTLKRKQKRRVNGNKIGSWYQINQSVSQPVSQSARLSVCLLRCIVFTVWASNIKKKRGSLSKRMISEIAQQKGCIDPRLRA